MEPKTKTQASNKNVSTDSLNEIEQDEFNDINNLNKQISKETGSTQSLCGIADYYWNVGNLLMAQNEYGEAVTMFIKATKLNPIKAEYYEKARDCYIELEEHSNALLHHTTVLYIRCQGLIPYEELLFMLELFSLGYFKEYQVESTAVLTTKNKIDNNTYHKACKTGHAKRYQFHNKVYKRNKLYRNSKRKFKYYRW